MGIFVCRLPQRKRIQSLLNGFSSLYECYIMFFSVSFTYSIHPMSFLSIHFACIFYLISSACARAFTYYKYKFKAVISISIVFFPVVMLNVAVVAAVLSWFVHCFSASLHIFHRHANILLHWFECCLVATTENTTNKGKSSQFPYFCSLQGIEIAPLNVFTLN